MTFFRPAKASDISIYQPVFFDGAGRKLSCYSKEAPTCARILGWRENQSAPSFLSGSVQGVIYEKCYLHGNSGLGKYSSGFNCLTGWRCGTRERGGKWRQTRGTLDEYLQRRTKIESDRHKWVKSTIESEEA
ncbi:hypothetical protein RRG08_026098 [Elysia crispata]|uniref:Uncharacterized protein n=1 Tax=Elysia crispata TaxID=231223 RepID=A0AAE0YR76_9GAST|nr:hypothetical protein RRG08_026098 [Elysia crispata]